VRAHDSAGPGVDEPLIGEIAMFASVSVILKSRMGHPHCFAFGHAVRCCLRQHGP